jgi:histidinol phosphatase-like PHP family hydrolase
MREKYPYLYETHLHTNRGSACAHNTGVEMARAAKEAGYAGIIVTEHNWGGNTCVDRSLPWEKWVRQWIRGYEEARAYGETVGLDVFWGYEAGFWKTEADGAEFLIYGVTPQWLIEHPQIKEADVEQQYDMIHEAGGMVIQAHPFREESYIPKIKLFPVDVDGVEGINATHSNHKSSSHNDPMFDVRAVAYAREHNLPMTAGSDIHSTELYGGGVAFRRRLTSIEDYCKAILTGEDYILTNGDQYFDKYGKPLKA